MIIQYTSNALKHLEYWKKNNPKIYNKIKSLIKSIDNDPYSGIGKPEKLKYNLSGSYSRRITQEHRIVYRVIPETNVLIISMLGHYN